LIDRDRILILRPEDYSKRRFIRRGSANRCGNFSPDIVVEKETPMGLISESGDRGETSENLINRSELNIRVLRSGTPLGMSNVCVPRHRKEIGVNDRPR